MLRRWSAAYAQTEQYLEEVQEVELRLAPAPPALARVDTVPLLYASTAVRFPTADPQQRQDIERALRRALTQARIRSIEVQGPGESVVLKPPFELDTIPLVALLPMSYLAQPQRRGFEVDAQVMDGDGQPWVISTMHEPAGHLVAIIAPGNPAPRPTPAPPASLAAAIERRYGVKPVRGDKSWAQEELNLLARALAHLSEPELAPMEGLLVRRVGRVSAHAGEAVDAAAGLYNQHGDQRWVEVGDVTFAHDQERFLGLPNDPQPASVGAILHELGHVIAQRVPFEMELALHRTVNAFNSTVNLFNLAWNTFPRSELPDYQRAQREMNELKQKVDSAVTARNSAQLRSPLIAAWAEVPGAGSGPTPYGRTHLAESFAEAFALYHVDPDALRRVMPAGYEFFAQGRHLEKPNS